MSWLKTLSFLGFFLMVTSAASAQIVTGSCKVTLAYCAGDTVTLAPQDTVTYDNFQWYSQGMPDVLITAGNAATYNVDPGRLGNYALRVSNPGGTYILTSEYSTPAGCATKNDTLVINFLPVPNLVTVPDTICQGAGETANLTALVTDGNSVAGSLFYYNSLAEAQAGGASTVATPTAVAPTSTQKYYFRKNTAALDAENDACYDIDSVQIVVRCLSLGNVVWYDTNNNGEKEPGEAGINGVTVNLYYDADANGTLAGAELTPLDDVTTAGGGLYVFENLVPGKYFVGIPPSEFGVGETLQHLHSSGTTLSNAGVLSEGVTPSANSNDSDTDDNGTLQTSGDLDDYVMTDQIMLMYNTEPTGENPNNSSNPIDLDANLAADFGFYGLSIGSLVFMDTDNNATFSGGGDMGIPGVTVKLYAQNGTTVLATTTTDADGQYLFTGLAEGNYIVGVDTTASGLDGKISSTDGSDAATPNTLDNDDNGTDYVGNEIQSEIFTLDAGNGPTGESDEADTNTGMGNPAVTDNVASTDNNTNLHVDFGFAPICPTITAPLGAQTLCANDAVGDDLEVETSQNAVSIRFVRFTSAQTGDDMYTGGTQIGADIAPVNASAPYSAVLPFNTAHYPNNGTTAITYYVYAILATAPSDLSCRPYQEIQVVVNPLPNLVAHDTTVCVSSPVDLSTLFTANAVAGTLSYYDTYQDALNETNPLPSSTVNTAVTNEYFVRKESAATCFDIDSIDVSINALPDFTLTLPTVCPGDEPTLQISGLTNGDALLSMMKLNSGTFNPYQANYQFNTADGLNLGVSNSVTVKNENGCETTKSTNVPSLVAPVCVPVVVTKTN